MPSSSFLSKDLSPLPPSALLMVQPDRRKESCERGQKGRGKGGEKDPYAAQIKLADRTESDGKEKEGEPLREKKNGRRKERVKSDCGSFFVSSAHVILSRPPTHPTDPAVHHSKDPKLLSGK